MNSLLDGHLFDIDQFRATNKRRDETGGRSNEECSPHRRRGGSLLEAVRSKIEYRTTRATRQGAERRRNTFSYGYRSQNRSLGNWQLVLIKHPERPRLISFVVRNLIRTIQ